MTDQGVVVLGISIPSASPIFLSIVAVHVAAGLVCTVAGIGAMSTPKRAIRMLGPSITGTSWWFPFPWPPSPSFGGQRTHTSSCSTSCPSALERSDEWRGGASGAGGSRSTSQAWRCRTPATHRVLCGQRTTSSALEFSAAARVLGRSKSCRASDSGLGAPETYEDAKRQRTGTATRHKLNSRRSWRRMRSHPVLVALVGECSIPLV